MNRLDFSRGYAAGSAGVQNLAAAEQEAASAISDWKSFSNRLQSRLSDAEKRAIHNEAMLAARDAQQKALREALREIAPNHPLLAKIRDIGDAALVESYRANGYHCDLSTDTLHKI